MTSRRLLVLTPRYPYPVIGGDRLRIYEICRELAGNYDLTLLSLCETHGELNAPLPNDGVFKQVERIYLPRWRSVLNVVGALASSTPLQIAYYQSTAFANALKVLLPKHDVCLAHLIRTGHYVRNSSVPVVLEMTDAISMNYQRVINFGANRGLRSLIYAFEAKRLLGYERGVINDFAAVTLVSELDRAFLVQDRHCPQVLVASNGVNLEALPFSDRLFSQPVGVFIGNMASLQNLDACIYFAEEVLPVIRRSIDFTFRVVGRIKPADARVLSAFEGVEVAANVDSIVDAVKDARVGLAPVRMGAGVQNKVLEYMALGLPVITSSLALEGLGAKPNQDLLVADSPEEYLGHVVRLWQHVELRSQMAGTAFEYVRCHHSWKERLTPLVSMINHLF